MERLAEIGPYFGDLLAYGGGPITLYLSISAASKHFRENLNTRSGYLGLRAKGVVERIQQNNNTRTITSTLIGATSLVLATVLTFSPEVPKIMSTSLEMMSAGTSGVFLTRLFYDMLYKKRISQRLKSFKTNL